MRGAVLALILAACTPSPLPGTPAQAGTYTGPGGTTFRVDARGVWDNGDNMNCRTGVQGSTLTLDCHGHRLTAVWTVRADGSVETDIIDLLYGEGRGVTQVYKRVP